MTLFKETTSEKKTQNDIEELSNEKKEKRRRKSWQQWTMNLIMIDAELYTLYIKSNIYIYVGLDVYSFILMVDCNEKFIFVQLQIFQVFHILSKQFNIHLQYITKGHWKKVPQSVLI